MKWVITMDGLLNEHSKDSIYKALFSIDGVTDIHVNVKEKKAEIMAEYVTEGELSDVITDLGYDVVSIVHE